MEVGLGVIIAELEEFEDVTVFEDGCGSGLGERERGGYFWRIEDSSLK